MSLKRRYRKIGSSVLRAHGPWAPEKAMETSSGKQNGVSGTLAPFLASKKQMVESPFNADYLQRLKSRDKETTDHFDSYFRQRLRLKLNGHRVRHDVDDLIQDTLLRVLNAVDKEEIRTPAAFGGYVCRVCDFLYYGWLHRKKIDESCVDVDEVDLPDPTPGHDTLFLYGEKRKRVTAILESLRPKDRNLLRAKLFDELSQEEMCERFNVSSDNLRVLLHRARKKFANAWKKQN